RLRVPDGIGRAAAELVLAGLGLPAVRPAAPSEVRHRLPELGVGPGLAAVGADLDALDRRPARPGAAFDRARAGVEESPARKEVRDPGWHEERAREDPGDGHALLVLRLAQAVRDR